MADPKVKVGTPQPTKRRTGVADPTTPSTADVRKQRAPSGEAPVESKLGRKIGEDSSNERVRTTGRRHAQVVAQSLLQKPTAKDASLEAALKLRGRETITARAYETNLEN